MASINGDWFHSRSSSNLNELLTVRRLVFESRKLEYIGFGWSGGRMNNPQMYRFAHSADIEPSTMQTKIRAMIRYGFVKEGNQCPLEWTRVGSLWNDLYSVGNYSAAKSIYEITLTISLAIYAFNDSPRQFSMNPSEGELPLKTLLNLLENHSISISTFRALVDGNKRGVARNFSYWKADLINSGLFAESNSRLIYTGKYEGLTQDIKRLEPDPSLTTEDWAHIRDNPLIEVSPFHDSLKSIFLEIAEQQEIEKHVRDEILSEPLIEIVSEEEDNLIPEIDILSEGTRITQTNRRVRNATWALRIKKKYSFRCAVPNCDVQGELFVEAAHIKPDGVQESHPPHRAHILNGLCLCRHCHILFDKGYFSLTDDYKVITSRKLSEIIEQNLKRVVISSENQIIKSRIDRRWPLVDFIRYHRQYEFRN